MLRKNLLIKRGQTILNRTIKLFPLEFFDSDNSFILGIQLDDEQDNQKLDGHCQ